MTAINLKLRKDQHAMLKAESARTGAPVNELIRRAIDQAFKTKQG